MTKMRIEPASSPSDVLTEQQMRKLEADAIASGRVSGRDLMETAGQCVVEAIAGCTEGRAPGRAVVLCGPGNNGGDGYVAARLLQDRGWEVAVFAMGAPDSLPSDARAMRARWSRNGEVADLASAPVALAGADLVVDALFGIGLTRPLSPDISAVIAAVPESALRVAVDVPSGRETDTGETLGNVAFPADVAVTFHKPKRVHTRLAREGVQVFVADIGL